MITITNLSKAYGKQLVLENVNLSFEKGRAYGIVGANGAGKTTLFRCIAGLESYEGQIRSSFAPLKEQLGFLETNPWFFSHITGREYLRLLCQARRVPLPDLDEKNIFELPLHRYAQHYSTGMKKKLAFTSLLLQKNEVFILDEPFNGVDIHSNILITEILRHLKSRGNTLLISSHIFSTLQDTCDEIYLLKNRQVDKKVGPEQFQELESEMRSTDLEEKLKRIVD
jgi:ABC-2 type transport system ATP-binding protein